jgi:hypothetical protein
MNGVKGLEGRKELHGSNGAIRCFFGLEPKGKREGKGKRSAVSLPV